MIGVPPTCGFFSKWYLLLGAIDAGQWAFVAALLICTLINVALFFKIFDQGLYLHRPGSVADAGRSTNGLNTGDAPLSMLLPASALALAILLIGIFNQPIVDKLIRFAVPLGL